MLEDPDSFKAIKSHLSSKTLQDIEGLDPSLYGFGREECCGSIPESLPNSMKMDKEHVMLASTMPFTQWSKLTDNVPHYTELHRSLQKDSPRASLTVCETNDDECVLRFRTNPNTGCFEITQYSISDPVSTPWTEKGTLQVDRTDECFIFVCSHLSRDKRCGYCGAVLVDLLRQAVLRKMGEDGAKRVSVLPCAHIGGHIYAGNVILYRKSGGVAFGLFKPSDVDTLVDAVASGTDEIPESLRPRIRGQLYSNIPVTKESNQKCAIM
ncbi:unnamed protein product [Phytomonas sp. EM1]|nr:unnamed protein product [Phytomonas sp. EM1]|eukprot:CCW63257.1 unnamed protein product [Phytomonas sp. isolate EM1]